MRYTLLIIACVWIFACKGQDTVTTLPAVKVMTNRITDQQEAFNTKLLRVNSFQNFSELLQKQSGIFIKRQGTNALSTASYQGLGSMHIPISIGGLNMLSSMNGNLDLSLISSFHFDQASFQDPDVNLGSPGLGKTLNIEPSFVKPLFVAAVNVGSFGEYGLGLKFKRDGSKIRQSISILGSSVKNNYSLSHYDAEKYDNIRLENANGHNFSGLYSIKLNHLKKAKLNSTIYAQLAQRAIPGSLSAPTDANQSDNNVMWLTEFAPYLKNYELKFNHALRFEEIGFVSDKTEIDALSRVITSVESARISRSFKHNVKTALSLQNMYSAYRANMIEFPQYQLRTFGNLGIEYEKANHKINVNADIIVETSDIYFGAGLNYIQAYRRFLFKLGAHKVNRLPTLNELYWYEPGRAHGNLNLKPEQGYRSDLAIIYNTKNGHIKLVPFVGYYESIILWGIDNGETSPDNSSPVATKGIEFNFLVNHTVKKCTLSWLSNAHLVSSTYINNTNEKLNGKQLRYIPQITGNTTLSAEWAKMYAYINAQYVGRNYYTSDNILFIEPYLLMELGLYRDLKSFRLGILAGNLLNTAYYSYYNYPLPGRNMKIQINYTLKKKSNEKV